MKPRAKIHDRRKSLSPAVIPMYLWTILFVAVPLFYILGMSFLKKAETWGVVMEDRKSVV